MDSVENLEELKYFASRIAYVGDGELGGPNDGYVEIQIPHHNILKQKGDPIWAIVDSTFPIFQFENFYSDYLIGRAILTLTLEVDEINEYMNSMNTYYGRTHFSCDTAYMIDYSTEIVVALHTWNSWMGCDR